MRYILDTCILIDYLRGEPSVQGNRDNLHKRGYFQDGGKPCNKILKEP